MKFRIVAWRVVKTLIRQTLKIAITVIHNFIPNVPDLFLGFFKWPQKHLRIHILILTDPLTSKPVVPSQALRASIDFAEATFKKNFNVKLRKYLNHWEKILPDAAPLSALKPGCGTTAYWQEFGEAGDYFNRHLAGWYKIAGMPFTYPITVYVVKDVQGTRGCSLGPVTDYIVIDPDGIQNVNTLAHELGHACNLWHIGKKSNIMYHHYTRGNGSNWIQCNIFRSCRHVNYY